MDGSLGSTPAHQGTGPSVSVLPVVGIPVVRDAARGLHNWLAEGTEGLSWNPGPPLHLGGRLGYWVVTSFQRPH